MSRVAVAPRTPRPSERKVGEVAISCLERMSWRLSERGEVRGFDCRRRMLSQLKRPFLDLSLRQPLWWHAEIARIWLNRGGQDTFKIKKI